MSIHQNKLRPPAQFDTKMCHDIKMCNDIERARAATTSAPGHKKDNKGFKGQRRDPAPYVILFPLFPSFSPRFPLLTLMRHLFFGSSANFHPGPLTSEFAEVRVADVQIYTSRFYSSIVLKTSCARGKTHCMMTRSNRKHTEEAWSQTC